MARTFYLNLKQDSLCSVWRPVSPKARPLRLAKIHLMHNRQSIFQLRSRELLNLKSCLRISSVSSVSMCPLLTMYEGEDLIPPSFTLLYPAIHHPGRPRPLYSSIRTFPTARITPQDFLFTKNKNAIGWLATALSRASSP